MDLESRDFVRAQRRHQRNPVQPPGHEFPGLGKGAADIARQHRRPHQLDNSVDGPERFRLEMDVEARLFRFERRFRPNAAGRASLLLIGCTLEHANYRRRIRPYGFPLQSGEHRRSIQRQSVLVRAERRRLRRPHRRLDQAAHVRHALRPQYISAHPRDLPAGEGAAAGPHSVLSLRRLRHSSGQIQKGRRRESDRPYRRPVFRHGDQRRSGIEQRSVRRGSQCRDAGLEGAARHRIGRRGSSYSWPAISRRASRTAGRAI